MRVLGSVYPRTFPQRPKLDESAIPVRPLDIVSTEHGTLPQWILVSIPEFGQYPDPFLIGAEGDQLVFPCGYGAAFLRVLP